MMRLTQFKYAAPRYSLFVNNSSIAVVFFAVLKYLFLAFFHFVIKKRAENYFQNIP